MRGRLAFAVIVAAGPAAAHGGDASGGGFGLVATGLLGASLVLYATGVLRLWRRAGFGRGVRPLQVAAFAAGWLLLALAILSPLHSLGEGLFSAHMIEHEILMVLAAPLLVLARPFGGMLFALSPTARTGLGRAVRLGPLASLWRCLVDPLNATLVHGVALWVWHVPALYAAALAQAGLHWLQHLSFFVTAVLFWWAILRGRARERGYGAAIFYLFATALHSGFLGILLAVARAPLVATQSGAAAAWGLTPLEDQQLAGLIMWVPAGLVYAGAALALAGLWIGRSGARAGRGGYDALVTD